MILLGMESELDELSEPCKFNLNQVSALPSTAVHCLEAADRPNHMNLVSLNAEQCESSMVQSRRQFCSV